MLVLLGPGSRLVCRVLLPSGGDAVAGVQNLVKVILVILIFGFCLVRGWVPRECRY